MSKEANDRFKGGQYLHLVPSSGAALPGVQLQAARLDWYLRIREEMRVFEDEARCRTPSFFDRFILFRHSPASPLGAAHIAPVLAERQICDESSQHKPNSNFEAPSRHQLLADLRKTWELLGAGDLIDAIQLLVLSARRSPDSLDLHQEWDGIVSRMEVVGMSKALDLLDGLLKGVEQEPSSLPLLAQPPKDCATQDAARAILTLYSFSQSSGEWLGTWLPVMAAESHLALKQISACSAILDDLYAVVPNLRGLAELRAHGGSPSGSASVHCEDSGVPHYLPIQEHGPQAEPSNAELSTLIEEWAEIEREAELNHFAFVRSRLPDWIVRARQAAMEPTRAYHLLAIMHLLEDRFMDAISTCTQHLASHVTQPEINLILELSLSGRVKQLKEQANSINHTLEENLAQTEELYDLAHKLGFCLWSLAEFKIWALLRRRETKPAIGLLSGFVKLRPYDARVLAFAQQVSRDLKSTGLSEQLENLLDVGIELAPWSLSLRSIRTQIQFNDARKMNS